MSSALHVRLRCVSVAVWLVSHQTNPMSKGVSLDIINLAVLLEFITDAANYYYYLYAVAPLGHTVHLYYLPPWWNDDCQIQVKTRCHPPNILHLSLR